MMGLHALVIYLFLNGSSTTHESANMGLHTQHVTVALSQTVTVAVVSGCLPFVAGVPGWHPRLPAFLWIVFCSIDTQY